MNINVLDHGYVEFVEAWGTGHNGRHLLNESPAARPGELLSPDYEVGIIEAARQSTQGNFRGWETDQKLLTYLFEHKHMTPFEMSGMTIEVQAPIFVFREWHRHRTQSYNETSARYAALPDLYYVPSPERLLMGSEKNKQAGGTGAVLPSKDTERVLTALRDRYALLESTYQQYLAMGVPKELARLVMPVGHYSRMRASANLRNWLAFLTLRMDPAAQWEIRQYANAVGQVISQHFPRTWGLFNPETK